MTTPTANNKLLTNFTETVNFGRPIPRLTVLLRPRPRIQGDILNNRSPQGNKVNNVFKDGIGVQGLRFKLHGNIHCNNGN